MATAKNPLPLWLINYLSNQGLFRSYYDTAADTLNQFTEQAPVASTTQEFTRSYIPSDSFDPNVDMFSPTGIQTSTTGIEAPSLDLNDLAEALGLSSVTDALGLTSPDEVDLDTEQASAYSTGYSTAGIGGVADAVIGNPNFSLQQQIGVAIGSLAAPAVTNMLGPLGSLIGLFGQVANQYGGAYSDLSEATEVSVDPTTGTVSWSTPDNPSNFDTGTRAANTIANMPSTLTVSMPGVGKVTAQQLQNQIDQFGYNRGSLFGIDPESFEDTFGFSRSDLDAFGFTTEAEKSAAIAMTDLMSEAPGAFTRLDFSLGQSVAGGRGFAAGPSASDFSPDFSVDPGFGYEDYSEADVSGVGYDIDQSFGYEDYSEADVGDGGGGGDGGKVICTALKDMKLLDEELWRHDGAYGLTLPLQTRQGYWKWGVPTAKFIRKNKWAAKLIKPVVTEVAKEMAHRVGYGKGSKVGKALLYFGLPLCNTLGSCFKSNLVKI